MCACVGGGEMATVTFAILRIRPRINPGGESGGKRVEGKKINRRGVRRTCNGLCNNI